MTTDDLTQEIESCGEMASEYLMAIDIGNTQTVMGVLAGDRLVAFWRLSSGIGRTGDELAVFVDSLCHEYRDRLRSSGSIVIGSVVPMLTREYELMASTLFGSSALIVTSDINTGITIDIPDPHSLGADRIANAAAISPADLPAIVVDLGTATTFDVINHNSHYLGGAIAPGIRTSADELFRRAAKLPKVEICRPGSAMGQTTEASIQSGVFYGAVGAIDGIVKQLMTCLDEKPHVIATGGLASLIAQASETIERVDEALTLRGLAKIHRLNEV